MDYLVVGERDGHRWLFSNAPKGHETFIWVVIRQLSKVWKENHATMEYEQAIEQGQEILVVPVHWLENPATDNPEDELKVLAVKLALGLGLALKYFVVGESVGGHRWLYKSVSKDQGFEWIVVRQLCRVWSKDVSKLEYEWVMELDKEFPVVPVHWLHNPTTSNPEDELKVLIMKKALGLE